MYDSVRTDTITERDPIFVSDDFVILQDDNGKEVVVKITDCEFYSNFPCLSCNSGCYNYQIGDCKNFKWVKGQRR